MQENKLKMFVLARFLHHNILELKDPLFLHSHFIAEETEVSGDWIIWGHLASWKQNQITNLEMQASFPKHAAQGSSECAEVLGRGQAQQH